MSMKRLLFMMAAAASLFVGDSARASYNYSTSLFITGVSAGTFTNSATGATATFGGTTLTLTNVSRTGFLVPGTNTVNIGEVAVTTTTLSPSSDTFVVNYRDVFTLTNVPPPGTPATGAFTLNGVLTLSQVNTGNGVITNVYIPPLTATGPLGEVIFTGAVDNFGNPTINGAPGNLGGTITAEFIPEPASIVMLGLGLGGIGLVGYRKFHVHV